MGINSIKTSRLDKKFSKLVRTLARGRCEYCLKRKDFKELQTSHFWGRRMKSVRWDLENCAGLCFYCHKILGENPEQHRAFFLKRLGDAGYKRLMLRANLPQKPDWKMLEIWVDQELKKIA